MQKFRHIVLELKRHIPFTAFGDFVGILIMSAIILANISSDILGIIFHIFHPLHVFLSAFVTTSMYRLHKGGKFASILIGFVGGIGMCSLSDIIFPYAGSALLGVEIYWHLCVLEHPYLIIPSAVIGIAISYLKTATKCPHGAHIFVSVSASLFYLVSFGLANWLYLLPFVFLLLFVAVLIPCCISDIVFPHLFIKEEKV